MIRQPPIRPNRVPFSLTLMMLSIVLCSCRTPKDREERLSERNTTDDAELFFKNLRQSDYEVREMKGAGINAYVHKELANHAVSVSINHHWRDDKASIMLQFSEHTLPVTILRHGAVPDRIDFTGASIQNHIEVALFMSEAINEDQSPILLSGDHQHAILENKSKRNAFRTTIKDYLNLIGVKD